jgi:hypothetical protein
MADDADVLRRVYNTVAHSDSDSSVLSSAVSAQMFRQSQPAPSQPSRQHQTTTSPISRVQQARVTPASAPVDRRETVSTDTDDDDDEEVETLRVISRRVGKAVRDIRSMNPHLEEFDDSDPLPPGTKIVFKRPAAQQQQPPSSLPTNSRGPGAAPQQLETRRLDLDNPAPHSGGQASLLRSGSAAGAVAESGLTLRMLGAKFRRTRNELIAEIPEFQAYDLDDNLPRAVLVNRSINGYSLTEMCPNERSSPRSSAASITATARRPFPSPEQQSYKNNSSLSSNPNMHLSGSTHSTQLNKTQSPQRTVRPMSPLQQRPTQGILMHPSREAVTPTRGRPLSPSLSTRNGQSGDTRAASSPAASRTEKSTSDPEFFSDRHRRRESSRSQRMTMRCKIPHKIFVTPAADARGRFEKDDSFSADDDRYSIRTIARHVARCSIDDLLDMNPELETLFGVDDFIPSGTAVCVPPGSIIPKPRRPAMDDLSPPSTAERSYGTQQSQRFVPPSLQVPMYSASNVGDDGFVDVETPRMSRAPSLGGSIREGTSVVPPRRTASPPTRQHADRFPQQQVDQRFAQATRNEVPKILMQSVVPSAALGRTLSELAWSLGTTVDDIRTQNPDANQFASHEILPSDFMIHVPVITGASSTPIDTNQRPKTASEERAAIMKRAQQLRLREQLQVQDDGDRPQYRRCTSPSHSRGVSPVSNRGTAPSAQPPQRVAPTAATPAHSDDPTARQGLRTASASIEADTNLRRFVVTNSHLTVDLIAKRLGVHPDTIYDLNANELVEGPHGVYHFRETLPIGMLLRLPITR